MFNFGKNKIFSKIILVIFSLNIFLLPLFSKAQIVAPLPVIDAGAISVLGGMATELGIISTSIGIPGVEQGIISGVSASVDALCKGIAKAEEVVATADTFGNFSLIGGSPAEAAKITAKLTALQTVKSCREAQLEAFKKAPVTSLIIGQELVRKQAALSTEINELGIRIENLTQRQSQTYKDVLKAVSVKLLLNFSHKLTTRLINSLIAKYKIGNYLKYADAVATQIYEKQHITQNYPDKESQLIVASVLNSDVFNGGILPAVRVQAGRNLGFIPEELVVSDPDYWVKLAQVGNAKADPYFMQSVFEGRADLAKATGLLNARTEISQGKGFIPVRNCQGSVIEQNNIYRQNLMLSYKAQNDREVLERLKAEVVANPNNQEVRSSMQLAAAQYGKSQEDLSKLPTELNSPIVEICSAITNPGAFMADGITSLLKSQIDQSANIKTENLPFYGQFILTVANGLISNIFEGGHSNLRLLTEAGVNTANILSVDYLNGLQQPSELQSATNGIENGGAFIGFDGIESNTPQPAGTYNLKWDARNFPDIDDVTVFGVSGYCLNSVNGQCRPITALSGSLPVNLTQPGSYEFKLDLYTKGNTGSVPNKTLTARITIAQTAPTLTQGNGGGQNVCGGNFLSPVDCLSKTGDQNYCSQVCSGVLGAKVLFTPLDARGSGNNILQIR